MKDKIYRHNALYLTEGKLLARNTILNIIGLSTPLLAAIVAIPILIKGLGTARFGILSIIWTIIGYSNIFDLGLGRTLTKFVAEKIGEDNNEEIPTLVWTSLFFMLVLGIIGSFVLYQISHILVYNVIKIPDEFKKETLQAFYFISFLFPILICTAGLRGILEAHQYFGFISAIRTCQGLFMFVGPLIVLIFTKSLLPIVVVLAVGRLIGSGVYLFFCLHSIPSLRRGLRINLLLSKSLLSYGGWLTVSNILSPIMHNFDRLIISVLISITAVAYYVTPFEVITKPLIYSASLIGVLFPAFSTTFVNDSKRTAFLLDNGCKYVFLLIAPVMFILVNFAHEGLNFWLGQEFSKNSTFVLQILSVGVLINSISQILFSYIQGIGRPDLTAKLHIFELPFYLLSVWWLIRWFGIEGAAIAWVLRISIDSIFLYKFTLRLLTHINKFIKYTPLIIGSTVIILLLSMVTMSIIIKLVYISFMLSLYLLIVWFYILAPLERISFQKYIKVFLHF